MPDQSPPQFSVNEIRRAEEQLRRADALLRSGDPEGTLKALDGGGEAAKNHPVGQILAGHALMGLGRIADAVNVLQEAATAAPNNPDIRYGLALALQQTRRPDEALAAYDAALKLRPDFPVAALNRAVLLLQRGRPAEALAACDRLLARHPALAEAHYNRGLVLQSIGRRPEALAALDSALRHNPAFIAAAFNRGVVLQGLKRLDEALAAFDAVLVQQPDSTEALLNRGEVLRRLKRFDDALACFDRAIELQPNFAEADFNRAFTLRELNRLDDALEALNRLLSLHPDHVEGLINRGALFKQMKRLPEALADYDRAVALRPQSPDAHYGRGFVLAQMERPAEALTEFDAAIAADPTRALSTSAMSQYDRGGVLAILGRYDESEQAYRDALRLDPDFAEAHFGLAAQLLARGELSEAWPHYEHRRLTGRFYLNAFNADLIPKTADAVAGKKILIFMEQGFGDTLQFARFLRPLARIAGEVTFLTVPELHRLLANSFPDVIFRSRADKTEDFDFRIPLMSLPRLFNTDLETIPKDFPYIVPFSDRVARWKERLGDRGFKVGVNWQGNPAFLDDKRRSSPLRHFHPLSKLEGVRLISIQKIHGLDQLTTLPAGMNVETLGEDYEPGGPDAFLDASAVMANLDLVVSSCTAIPHLAGALGRPVWLALHTASEWRWLRNRSDSPWYPSARLFRQKQAGDWDSVFEEMALALAAQLPGNPANG
ncbi:MAG: tetratricopeptide repeat protein [Bauldia sp.]